MAASRTKASSKVLKACPRFSRKIAYHLFMPKEKSEAE
jgi:hypothetical protein